MQDKYPFSIRETIRFHHCDPAGIVFYPQYLVMLHALIERWFDDGLNEPYARLISTRRLGIPVVRLDCEFFSPSQLGDEVTLSLSVERLGHSSIDLHLEVRGTDGDGAEHTRVRVRQTVVLMSLETRRAVPLPPSLRARMASQPIDRITDNASGFATGLSSQA
ncbi:thioesterase family protein [Cupriavidus sp. BIC8F]|uniref:acyl-CoA thioesterase n=1 Tax=Cupriavidus sp. BIC8F TaxID=3079014 RepID=UPI00291691F9|nr:thioesterase family protein [Cupriavidus sp. BIC8F]